MSDARHGLHRHTILARATFGIALLLAAGASAYEGAPVADGGTIAGAMTYLGKVPPPVVLPIDKDPAVCGKTVKHDEGLIVSAGKGLKNVVVFLDKIERGKPVKPGAATLANTECRYEPHVQAFVVGTELAVSNSDPVLHNTHIKLPRSDVFNYGLPTQGQVVKKKVRRPGLMKVGCDAGHSWMLAWVAVFEHPYFAVTNADGRYTIADVPPGGYTLVFWHEKLGRKTQAIQVTAKGKVDASLAWK